MSTVILYTNRSQINPALYCHFTQYGGKFTQTSHILTAGAKIFAAFYMSITHITNRDGHGFRKKLVDKSKTT